MQVYSLAILDLLLVSLKRPPNYSIEAYVTTSQRHNHLRPRNTRLQSVNRGLNMLNTMSHNIRLWRGLDLPILQRLR